MKRRNACSTTYDSEFITFEIIPGTVRFDNFSVFGKTYQQLSNQTAGRKAHRQASEPTGFQQLQFYSVHDNLHCDSIL